MSLNPLRSLEFQDNPAAVQTNLRQIKQRWDQLVKHIPTSFAGSAAVARNSLDLGTLAAQLAALQAEVSALQAGTTHRSFEFFLS